MADESTPLIQVVQIRPATQRYPHRRLRRFCTALLAIVPAIVIFAFLLSFFLPYSFDDDSDHLSHYWPWGRPEISSSWPKTQGLDYAELEDILRTTPDRKRAKEWSKYYTSGPHLAGKNLSQAIWTRERWQEFGIPKVDVVAYDIYINYPLGHRVALLSKGKSSDAEISRHTEDASSSWKVEFEASLEEDVLEDDPTSGLENRIPTFHGYSASGNVTAPYVYVNYGTVQDYDDLLKANVSLAGKIALIKYGGIFRGLKVKRAQELGMVGAIIYSDPGDDGSVTDENGVDTYPAGPARNPSAVQRGSVQFLSVAPGDPTTPGYPSKPGAPRGPVDGAIPSIPSVPISYLDALPLLKALNGHGPKASSINKYWQGGGLGYKGVEYNIGPSPENLAVNLVNEQEYVTTPIWNVIGVINGTIQDEVIILGNHRDAWIAGGAADPNSGSAAMIEVVRSFGKALEAGWKPLRTIVLASWDGEEYGLIGSTEWVEEYLPWLSKTAIAYLNVDVGASGPRFKTAAAPLLNKVLVEMVNEIQSPNQTVPDQTIGDVWDKHIATMGSGSDFTAFQDFAGVPCIDMGFAQGAGSPIYQYHSNYDSFAWMSKFGDPGFHYHETIARAWALLAAKLIETPVLRLNATDYALGLKGYLEKVKAKAHDSTVSDLTALSEILSAFKPLEKAIGKLHDAAVSFDAYAADLSDELADHDFPWWKWWQRVRLFYKVRRVNTKYKYLERQFLYQKGLDGRNWFKHVVFAPGIWTGYAGATFPGLVESIDNGDKKNARKWVHVITGLVEKAAASLDE